MEQAIEKWCPLYHPLTPCSWGQQLEALRWAMWNAAETQNLCCIDAIIHPQLQWGQRKKGQWLNVFSDCGYFGQFHNKWKYLYCAQRGENVKSLMIITSNTIKWNQWKFEDADITKCNVSLSNLLKNLYVPSSVVSNARKYIQCLYKIFNLLGSPNHCLLSLIWQKVKCLCSTSCGNVYKVKT